MLVWSTHERFSAQTTEVRYAGALTRVTSLRLTTHTGTHVDSPYHFAVSDQTVDRLPLNSLIGPARVYDLQGFQAITAEDLRCAGVGGTPRVLLKTDNSRWIRTGPLPDLPAHLTDDAAAYLIEKGILLLGLDGLTVDAPDRADVHLALFHAGVVILETIDLSAVAPGDYELICLPLRIAGGDGAPARAVLRK
jgi:arylformamidase